MQRKQRMQELQLEPLPRIMKSQIQRMNRKKVQRRPLSRSVSESVKKRKQRRMNSRKILTIPVLTNSVNCPWTDLSATPQSVSRKFIQRWRIWTLQRKTKRCESDAVCTILAPKERCASLWEDKAMQQCRLSFSLENLSARAWSPSLARFPKSLSLRLLPKSRYLTHQSIHARNRSSFKWKRSGVSTNLCPTCPSRLRMLVVRFLTRRLSRKLEVATKRAKKANNLL